MKAYNSPSKYAFWLLTDVSEWENFSLFLIFCYIIIESVSSFQCILSVVVLPSCKLFSAVQLHFDEIVFLCTVCLHV